MDNHLSGQEFYLEVPEYLCKQEYHFDDLRDSSLHEDPKVQLGSTKAFAGPSHLLQSRFDDDDDDRERTRSIALMCLLCLFLIWPSKIVIVGIELFPFLKYIDNPKNSYLRNVLFRAQGNSSPWSYVSFYLSRDLNPTFPMMQLRYHFYPSLL